MAIFTLAVTVNAVLHIHNITSHDPIVGLVGFEVLAAYALDGNTHGGISRCGNHVGRQLGYQLEKMQQGRNADYKC